MRKEHEKRDTLQSIQPLAPAVMALGMTASSLAASAMAALALAVTAPAVAGQKISHSFC